MEFNTQNANQYVQYMHKFYILISFWDIVLKNRPHKYEVEISQEFLTGVCSA